MFGLAADICRRLSSCCHKDAQSEDQQRDTVGEETRVPTARTRIWALYIYLSGDRVVGASQVVIARRYRLGPFLLNKLPEIILKRVVQKQSCPTRTFTGLSAHSSCYYSVPFPLQYQRPILMSRGHLRTNS